MGRRAGLLLGRGGQDGARRRADTNAHAYAHINTYIYKSTHTHTLLSKVRRPACLVSSSMEALDCHAHRHLSPQHTNTPGSEVLFKVRRPAYLISSSMEVLDCEDRVVGEVRQRWHPWRRNYDL